MLKLFKILGIFILFLILIPLILISLLVLPCLVAFLLYEFGVNNTILFTVSVLILLSEMYTIIFIIENWDKI